jgi:pyridoxine 4-dehydrogenase
MAHSLQLGDLTICRMGLGTNRITNSPEAHDLLRSAFKLGINFFDTANIYQDGESELSIAAALKPYAKHLCITTKGGFKKYGVGIYKPEGHPDKLKQNLEESLLRLQLNQIDLYQLHRVDPSIPIEDSLGALKDLQTEGKIRYFGLSEVSIPQIEKAQSIINVMTVQNHYNLFERNNDDVVDYCQQQGIIFIPFFPLGSARHLFSDHLMQTLGSIAKRYHSTSQQIALAWLFKRSSFILPIPGTLSRQHLVDNMSALSIELSPFDLEKLSEQNQWTPN